MLFNINKKNLVELNCYQPLRSYQSQPFGLALLEQNVRMDKLGKVCQSLKDTNVGHLTSHNLQKGFCKPNSLGSTSEESLVYNKEIVKKNKILTSNYSLDPFYRSNQDTSLVHKPVVFEGQWVEAGDLLADCSASVGGELSLGQNILIGYMPWEGYNFEDAILISERLVYDDLYTSIHIEKYETEIRETKLGIEEITREIPELGKKDLENLDSNGLIKIGSWVEEGDILVGKVTPISKKDQSPYQKLLYTILEKEFLPVCDSSFRAPKGIKAKVIDIKILKNFLPIQSISKQNLDKKSLNLKSKKENVKKLIKQKEFIKKDKMVFGKTVIHTNSSKQDLEDKIGKAKKSLQTQTIGLGLQRLETSKFQRHNKKIVLKSGPVICKPNPKDWVWKEKQYFFTPEGLSFQMDSLNKSFPNPKPSDSVSQTIHFNSQGEKSYYNRDKKVLSESKKPFKSKKNLYLSKFIPLINKNKPLKNNMLNSWQSLKVGQGFILEKRTHMRQKKFLTKLYFFKKHLLNKLNQKFGLAYPKFLKNFRENLNLLITQKLSSTELNKASIQAKSNIVLGFGNKTINRLTLTKSQVDNTQIKRFDKSLKKFIYSNQSTLKNAFILRSLFLEKNQINKKVGGTGLIKEEKKIESIEILLAEKRRVQVGDKMAGRHGNKGIISNILPREDMPYLPDGTPLDMVLNPLGVPSRMNVGQIYECLLGFAGRYLGENFKVFPFDEIYGPEASRSFVYSKLFEARKKTGFNWLYDPKNPGKIRLYDGRTGDCFDQPVTVGESYILRLVHMVDDKIHARSTGPYSLVTQQPLRGRSKKGGQRLGEMEVWALEGYGAAFTLLEMLTIKSDDMTGRLTLWSNIILNKDISIGTPESFKVLVCELQALCVDIELFRLNPKKKNNLLMIDNLMNLA